MCQRGRHTDRIGIKVAGANNFLPTREGRGRGHVHIEIGGPGNTGRELIKGICSNKEEERQCHSAKDLRE